LASTVAAL
jgi:hypothetical protein